MTSPRRWIQRAALALVVVAPVASLSAQSAPSTPRPAQARVALTRALPALDGAHLAVTLVEVVYEPGGASAAHRHPCPVVGYVLEGAVRMQLTGQPEAIYKAGDTFFETPADEHAVSANASATERARFLAYFTCDRDFPQLSVPSKPGGRQ